MEQTQLKSITSVHDGEGVVGVVAYLQELVEFTKIEENRQLLCPAHFKQLDEVLGTIGDNLCDSLDLLTEAFRFLRNSCANSPKNQNVIHAETTLCQRAGHLLRIQTLQREGGDMEEGTVTAQRAALQFLGNSIARNGAGCDFLVANRILNLEELLNGSDDKMVHFTAMIIHCILRERGPGLLLEDSPGLMNLILNKFDSSELLSIEIIVQSPEFTKIYSELHPEERVVLLRILNASPDMVKNITPNVFGLFMEEFALKSDIILKGEIINLNESVSRSISELAQLLSASSAHEGHKKVLNVNKTLLTTTIYLLKYVHQVGNESENAFTPRNKLGDTTSTPQELSGEPFFSFKAHLIRLVGNLAYREIELGDYVRELGTLPILLDCCKLDSRNPFIREWSILALRNLTEGNPVTQEYIRSVERQGEPFM